MPAINLVILPCWVMGEPLPGEHITPTDQRFDLQFKGSGPRRTLEVEMGVRR